MRHISKIFLIFTLFVSKVSSQNKLPNIVIIYADDMGFGDLACQNPDSKILTPNLDLLAKQGMRFTDAHSSSGVCSPSRYSLLTGRYHWRGHLKKGIVSEWGDPAIEENRMTIASMLKEKGYTTACIGKWHLGMEWPFKQGIGQKSTNKTVWKNRHKANIESFDWTKPIERGPVAVGFDYYFGDGTINFPPYTWIENDKVLEIPTEILNLAGKFTAEGNWECRKGPAAKNWDISSVPIVLTSKSVEYIKRQKRTKKPFFLYFALPSPHAPIVPVKQFQGISKAGGYGDYMEQTEWMVGQVLTALKENNLDEDTLVIFTSDNGPEKYAYNRIKNYGHKSMGNFRGLKRDLWEGGHRVPFIVKYPGVVPASTINKSLISQVDIFSTVAGIVGFEKRKNTGEDRLNFIENWKGLHKEPIRNSVVLHSLKGKFAIRKNNWLLIENKTGAVTKVPKWLSELTKDNQNTTPRVLYNLEKDPKELNNLFNEKPGIVKELQSLLNSIRN